MKTSKENKSKKKEDLKSDKGAMKFPSSQFSKDQRKDAEKALGDEANKSFEDEK
jgi:hypothetical protein